MAPVSDPLRDALVSALGAQYDILRLIGKGGMGAVYLGHERLLDRPVAIKVLPHETADTSDARDRFLREARIAARLTHPNIVPLFSFGEAGKTLFYVMGYVEGESLEQRLRRTSRLPFDEARRIIAELSSALDHAHALGIVHRDIKPDNVLIEAGTGRAVLADFGIARQQLGASLTQTGAIMGTPHYMSPEQASGEREIDGRSDLYALGVMGYRMLSGRLPFDGGSFQEIIAQHVTREPVPLNVVIPDVPTDLDVAVSRCLAKDPAARWSSAAMLRESLTGGEVETLPDELEKLPGVATSWLLTSYFTLWAGAVVSAGTGDPVWFVYVAGGMLVSLGAPLLMFREGRKARLPWKRIWQIAFWPPKSWPWSWPSAFRRPGDLWPRLPRLLRRMRASISASAALIMGIGVPSFILGMAFAFRTDPVTGGTLPQVAQFALLGFGAMMAGTLSVLVTYGLHVRTHRQFGLSSKDRDRLLQEVTWGSRFWKRPEIARLLSGDVHAVPAGMESPRDIIAAIEQLIASADEPARALLREAADGARDMARAIDAIDTELRELAAHDAPAERERLQQKLAALGAPRDGESAAAAHMRGLFTSQLDMMRDLAARGSELESRRARYLELLRTLWIQVSALRARNAVDALGIADVSGPIRELCRNAEALASADRLVQNLVAAPDTPTTPMPR